MLAVLALILLCARMAAADTIEQNVRVLGTGSSAKVRLAAVLALAKSKDPRAVIAVADGLRKDDDAGVRKVCALALGTMLDSHTAADAIALAFEALDRAQKDGDDSVRDAAAKIAKQVAGLRKKPTKSDKPEVFVKIDPATDQSKQAPAGAPDRVRAVVQKSIEKSGYVTSWPGGLPTGADLVNASSRAFVVASTVKKIEVSRVGRQSQIACTVSIRIAPWSGTDGGEKWEASKAANASGSAKAMTGPSERDVRSGVSECLEAVAEDLTSRQILPFLKRLVVASN